MSAIVLTRGALSVTERNLGKLLDFFGVSWLMRSPLQFLAENCSSAAKPCRVLASAEAALELITAMQRQEGSNVWGEAIHSLFIYPGEHETALLELSELLGLGRAELVNHQDSAGKYFVVTNNTEMCGSMAAVRIRNSNPSAVLFKKGFAKAMKSILSMGEDSACLFGVYNRVSIFITSSSEIIDLDAQPTGGIFDIRQHVLAAFPIVCYIKWAFASLCWQPAEINASLIIDDPPLKHSHGFVDFYELLALMKRHGFATTIAFIPWNWSRSSKNTVALFLENPEYYSLSIHGCDHTRAEFASGNAQELYAKTQRALARMAAHEKRTGIVCDRVMVFPQGVFSAAAMMALKLSGITGAVNNHTISSDLPATEITVADVWNIAVMKYGTFPLFTRRNPWEGIENFAFDAFLGKPILAVIHHDDCHDHYHRLIEFIDRLNSLKVRPVWRSLGEVIRRSYRQRALPDGRVAVETFATEIRLENDSGSEKHFRIKRQDENISAVNEIRIGSDATGWEPIGGNVFFDVQLGAGQNTLIQTLYRELPQAPEKRDGVWDAARIMLRRYLSEARDNYVTKGKLILASALGRKGAEWA